MKISWKKEYSMSVSMSMAIGFISFYLENMPKKEKLSSSIKRERERHVWIYIYTTAKIKKAKIG